MRQVFGVEFKGACLLLLIMASDAIFREDCLHLLLRHRGRCCGPLLCVASVNGEGQHTDADYPDPPCALHAAISPVLPTFELAPSMWVSAPARELPKRCLLPS